MSTPAPLLPISQREVAKVEHFRSGMLRRFGLLYHLSGASLILRRIQLERFSAENIRSAAQKGPVVYVLHTRSVIDWLALNRALNRRRLPLAVVTEGVRGVWFRPTGEMLRGAWRGLKRRLTLSDPPDPLGSGALVEAICRSEPTAVFLLRKNKTRAGLLEALLEAQQRLRRPIQLVPIVVLWRRAPDRHRNEVGRMLVGTEDEPGPLHKLVSVLTRARQDAVLVQAGESLELSRVLARYTETSHVDIARRLTLLLRGYLYRESRVVRGPRTRSYRDGRQQVLRSTAVREQITRRAQATGRSPERIRLEAWKTYNHIAARFSYPAVRISRALLNPLYNRIFAGIDVRDEDLERLRTAMRNGTPILVPCHRSHLDYMLISSICFEHNIAMPHIIARDNLSFFPLGRLLRRLGALFVRRGMRHDPLYESIFKRYLQQLIHDGFPVEFFIEGGRSRTGKLRPPRLKLLSMILDAATQSRPDREVTLLPVNITYEQIAEEQAYADELSGSDRREENLREVVQASQKLRGRRMGRVYLRVGEPLPAHAILHTHPDGWSAMPDDQRQELLERTGERLMHRIAQQTVMTPSAVVAMALLSGPAGVHLHTLNQHIERLQTLLTHRGAQATASLTAGGSALGDVLSRFHTQRLIEMHSDAHDDVVQVVDGRRIRLEYYKNTLLHFLAPISLLAAVIRATDRDITSADEEIFALFRTQVFLLRYEFTLDPEQSLEALEQESLQGLVMYGALTQQGDRHIISDRARIQELARLTDALREAYRLAIQAGLSLQSKDIAPKDIPKKMLVYGRARLAVGELSMPEALSLVNLETALRAYREEGTVQFRSGGGLQCETTAVNQYLSDLSRLLPPPRTLQ